MKLTIEDIADPVQKTSGGHTLVFLDKEVNAYKLLTILNSILERLEKVELVPENFKPHKKACCELWGACDCVSCECGKLDLQQRKDRKNTPKPSPVSTWEEDFKKYGHIPEEVITFITNLLQREKEKTDMWMEAGMKGIKEARIEERERIIGIVKGMKDFGYDATVGTEEIVRERSKTYNQALTYLLTQITKEEL